MITPDYVHAMAAYNAEMNRRVLEAAARLFGKRDTCWLPPPEYADPIP